MIHAIQVKTAGDAWNWALSRIDRFGDNVVTEDGQMTREIRNLMMTVENPRTKYPIEGSKWNIIALEKYANQLLDPEEKGFVYDYGSRLAREGQIVIAIQKLAEFPATRRAIMTTRDLKQDAYEQHTPCLQVVELMYRDNQLDMTCYFRSHDIRDAYPANVFGLATLQARIADELEILAGSLTTISASAHYYVD